MICPQPSFNHKVLWVSAAEFIIHRSPPFLLPLCIHSIITGLQSFGFRHPICVGHHVLHVRTPHILDLFHTQQNRTECYSGLKHENPDYVSDPVLFHLDSTRTYYIRFNKMWTVQPLLPPTSSIPRVSWAPAVWVRSILGLEEIVHCVCVCVCIYIYIYMWSFPSRLIIPLDTRQTFIQQFKNIPGYSMT